MNKNKWYIFGGGVVILSVICSFIWYQKNYTGYCQIVGTYRNRYVKCYGEYSPSAKRRAEEHAQTCNLRSDPIGGCTSVYR